MSFFKFNIDRVAYWCYNFAMEKQEFFKKLDNIFAKLFINNNSDIYRIVGKEFGYFDLPKKRSLSDLADFKVLYRGFRRKIYIKDFLTINADDFYIGEGNNYGKGIYTSRDNDIALIYTHSNFSTDNDRVLKIYIKDCNVIDYVKLIREIQNLYCIINFKNKDVREFAKEKLTNERAKAFIEFVQKFNDTELEVVFDLFGNHISETAIILGYDVIDLNNLSKEPNYLILNRSKIVVTDKEFRRITGIETKRVKRTTKFGDLLVSQKGE